MYVHKLLVFSTISILNIEDRSINSNINSMLGLRWSFAGNLFPRLEVGWVFNIFAFITSFMVVLQNFAYASRCAFIPKYTHVLYISSNAYASLLSIRVYVYVCMSECLHVFVSMLFCIIICFLLNAINQL